MSDKAMRVKDFCPDDCPEFYHAPGSIDPDECLFAIGSAPNYYPGPRCPLPDWPRVSKNKIRRILMRDDQEKLWKELSSKEIEIEE